MNYPDLSNAKMIAVDIETYDPYLIEMGNGVYRNDGYIMGVSLATPDGFAEYYSLHHYDTSKEEIQKNKQYIESVLSNNVPKLGVNFMYDLDWLENWAHMKVNGELNDIQIAEPLLDEYQGQYNLDFQAKKYLGIGKLKDEMDEWCEQHGYKGDARKWLWKMPYSLVQKYAKGDVQEPLQIFDKQKALMEEENLIPLYKLEMNLYKPIMLMRKNGIRVDRNKIATTVSQINRDVAIWEKELYGTYGEFNINSSQQIAGVFDRLNIEYPKTEKGNPAIDHQFLSFYCKHPIASTILKLRAAKKARDTFLLGAFSEYNVKDRIHPQFITMKRDEGGTVTGRLSCQNPNLQQVPAKDETYGPECRSVFIPEENCWYGKIDYSQVEYRIIAHYAMGPKSNEIKQTLNDDPHTDYHALVQRWIKEVTGTDLERKKVKNLNFGTAYYMGVNSMASKFGWSLELSKELNEIYFNTFPFLKPTRNEVVDTAKMRGYVRTILGRRARVSQQLRQNRKEYVVWNHLVQGTAADIMKKAMVDAYNGGIFNVLTPHITVHDELGVSVPKTIQGIEAFQELEHVMETCVKLKVPLLAEPEIGTSWGEVEEVDLNKLKETLC